jgi:hypothetical protein
MTLEQHVQFNIKEDKEDAVTQEKPRPPSPFPKSSESLLPNATNQEEESETSSYIPTSEEEEEESDTTDYTSLDDKGEEDDEDDDIDEGDEEEDEDIGDQEYDKENCLPATDILE